MAAREAVTPAEPNPPPAEPLFSGGSSHGAAMQGDMEQNPRSLVAHPAGQQCGGTWNQIPLLQNPYSPAAHPAGQRCGEDVARGVTDAAHLQQIDKRIRVDHCYFCV